MNQFMKNKVAIGEITNKITLEEMKAAIGKILLDKSDGCDRIRPKFLRNLGLQLYNG